MEKIARWRDRRKVLIPIENLAHEDALLHTMEQAGFRSSHHRNGVIVTYDVTQSGKVYQLIADFMNQPVPELEKVDPKQSLVAFLAAFGIIAAGMALVAITRT